MKPGTMLYDARKRWAANVRADGTLAIGERAGSIHRLGAEVQGLDACNGWTFWHYERNGGLTQIDELRRIVRVGMERAGAWTAGQLLQFQVRRSSSHGAIPRRSRSASSVLAFCEQHRLPAGRLAPSTFFWLSSMNSVADGSRPNVAAWWS